MIYFSEGFLDRILDSLNPGIATQAHPKNEDTIVSAQQPVKPMRASLTRCKGTIKQLPALREDAAFVEEQDREKDEGPNPFLPRVERYVNPR